MILDELRARVEAVLFDSYGTSGYTITAGRFAKPARDLPSFDASSERRARVRIGAPVPVEEGVNPADSYALMYRPLVVVIEYQRTGAGSDLIEGDDPRLGGADDETIEDRMSEDEHDVTRSLCWHEHWSGLDPFVASITRDGVSDRAFEGATATLSITLRVLQRETTTG